MKKIALLLVCAMLICTCCALASCTKEEENTSSAASSAASEAASSETVSAASSSEATPGDTAPGDNTPDDNTPDDNTPDDPTPIEDVTVPITHNNCYSWNCYEGMVVNRVGLNCTNSLYDYNNVDQGKDALPETADGWVAIKVDSVDGAYVVTGVEKPGDWKTAVVEEGGFILYVSPKQEVFEASQAIHVGMYATMSDGYDVMNGKIASPTVVGSITFSENPQA